MADRPLLFLDVDGPLNAYGTRPEGRPAGYTPHRWTHLRSGGTPGKPSYYVRLPKVWLHPGHGARLRALPYDLVWCTSWNELANRYIGPAVGLVGGEEQLPDLPLVPVGDAPEEDRPGGVHWKLAALLEYAAGRPFAWVDDEVTDADRAFVADRHAAPALLRLVDPATGLTDDDFETLAAWASHRTETEMDRS
ncbi:hypothetical protein [Kitasatospora viridis]|uniref:Secreted protein n=1 Tax=Kitasatospora viridis TaxID=281105 RepID=A0A561SA06_9ACTN|nr:hypothetical protein [Kitasatospora viridis]TWF71708.1 hypothetical protein FHX73_1879 [Kitasatospora viridis]